MHAGVSSFAFSWAVASPLPPAFTADTLLDFAVAQELPVIQFGDNLPLHRLSEPDLDSFARRARERGVRVETGARGMTPAHLQRYVELSRRLDARLLRFVIDAADYEPDLDTIIGLIRDSLPLLREADLVLGIENHDRFPSLVLRRLVEGIADERVGICLDTVNSLGAGEGIQEVLSALAPVCVNLHAKDFAIQRVAHQMGFTVSGRALGAGMLPLDRVLAAVAASGRCRSAVLELWTPPEYDPAATAAKEARWARESVPVLKAALSALHS